MSIDWGSVADWVGAVGGAGGAGTAALFYFLDRRRAVAADRLAQQKQTAFEKDVGTHLTLLLQNITDVAGSYLDGPALFADTVDFRAEMKAFAATANRIASIPNLPVDHFMDLCDILEVITDIRLEGRDPAAMMEATNQITRVTGPMRARFEERFA